MEMNVRKIVHAAGLTAAMTAVTLGLGGCVTGTQFPDTLKVQNVDSTGNKITVTDGEKVKVVLDAAEIEYFVYSSKDTAAACQKQNNKDLNAAIEVLKFPGVEEKFIQTSSYGLDPIYNWNLSNKEVTGYEMTICLTVSNTSTDKAGTIVSEPVAAGVNGIDSVSYFSSNHDASYQKALKGAMAVARVKADALAKASGRSIVGVVHVEELEYNPYVRNSPFSGTGAARVEIMAVAADMAAMPGEVSVEAQVTVDYEAQ